MFLVFKGLEYFPMNGKGWLSFGGIFNTKEEALTYTRLLYCDWWQIVDMETLSIVETSRDQY